MKYNIIPITMATCVCSDSTCVKGHTTVCICCARDVCYKHYALAELEVTQYVSHNPICYECVVTDRSFMPDKKVVPCSSVCFAVDIEAARRWKASTALITKAIR